MDINTTQFYADEVPANILRSEDIEGFTSPLKGFIYRNWESKQDNPQNNIGENLNSVEEEQQFINIASSNGEIFVRIPGDSYIFQDEESKQAYSEAVLSLLDSFNGYLDFAKVYANAASFPIPNSPRFMAEEIYHWLEEFRANADPVVPYELPKKPIDSGAYLPEEYSRSTILIDGEEVDFRCRQINLVNGIVVCSRIAEEGELADLDIGGADPHTIATILHALGIISQEYPFAASNLAEYYTKVGERFGTIDSIKNYIEQALEEFEQPAVPAKPYPHSNL